MNGTMTRLLVLAPHFDDAEFGCGGLMQVTPEMRIGGIGRQSRVVVVCSGDYVRSDGVEVLGGTRLNEAFKAFEMLGVTGSQLRGYPENGGPLWDYGRLVGEIERAVKANQPTDVLVCLPGFNQDHRALFDATVTAFRPGNLEANLLAYPYPGSCWGTDVPQWGKRYVRLSEQQVARKIAALNCHKSQFAGRKAGVGPEAARTLARQHGAEIGVEYAELFYVMKEVY